MPGKMVIFKEWGNFKVTTEANYKAFLRDAFKVQDCSAFENPEQIIAYYCKWFGSQESDFIVKC